MQAIDVMTTWAAIIGPDATIQEAAKLMFRRGISALPVISVTEATPLEKVALQLEKHRIKRGRVVPANALERLWMLLAGPRSRTTLTLGSVANR